MTDQEIIEKATRIMASTPPADLIQALADAGLLTGPHAADEIRRTCAEIKRARETNTRLRLSRAELADESRSLRERLERISDRLQRAEAERDEIAGRLSELLCDLTDGLLSKTGYDVRTMVSAVESIFEGHAERDRADVIAERDALAATVQRVRDLHKLDRDDDGRFCAQCCESWPCGTLEILDDPQEQR